MKIINMKEGKRAQQYEWFSSFSNPTYGLDVVLDVTKLVTHAKLNEQSFFIDMLYVVVKGLNKVEEMKLRTLSDGKVALYDIINPSYTVMTEGGFFVNVGHPWEEEFFKFYEIAKEHIQEAKKLKVPVRESYNLENVWNDYYITSLPWVNFSRMSHPIPDSVSSLSVPRICWGKYEEINERKKLTLNITVNHALVDGYPLSKAFIEIQTLLDHIEEILK